MTKLYALITITILISSGLVAGVWKYNSMENELAESKSQINQLGLQISHYEQIVDSRDQIIQSLSDQLNILADVEQQTQVIERETIVKNNYYKTIIEQIETDATKDEAEKRVEYINLMNEAYKDLSIAGGISE